MVSPALQGVSAEPLTFRRGATGFTPPVGCSRIAAVVLANHTAPFGESALRRSPRRLARVTVPVQVTFTGPCERRDEDIDPAAALTDHRGLLFVSPRVVASSNHRTT